MSIVNVLVYSDRAMIGVDTEAAGPDGSLIQVSKMAPLVHLNAVLAGRGSLPFFSHVAAACLSCRGSIADLFEYLPSALPVWFDELIHFHVANGYSDSTALDTQELVIAGWPPGCASPAARVYKQTDRTIGFVESDISWGWFSPWDASWASPTIKNMAELVHLANAQAQLIRSVATGVAAGGDFIVAEITQGGMEIRKVCDFQQRVDGA